MGAGGVGFRGGRVDGAVREGFAFAQAGGQGDPADGAVVLVGDPGFAGEVPPDDGFDFEGVEFKDLHAAVVVGGVLCGGDLRGQVQGEEVGAEIWD